MPLARLSSRAGRVPHVVAVLVITIVVLQWLATPVTRKTHAPTTTTSLDFDEPSVKTTTTTLVFDDDDDASQNEALAERNDVEDESNNGDKDNDDPAPPSNEQALSPRSRILLSRGVPLVDTWPETLQEWTVSPGDVNHVLAHIGDDEACDADAERRHVRMFFNAAGFGSTLQQMYNAIVYAVQQDKRFVLIETDVNGLAQEFFNYRTFSFPVRDDTVCTTSFADACPESYRNCHTLLRFRKPMLALRKANPVFYWGIKVVLWRLVTRLRDASVRREIDSLVLTTTAAPTTTVVLHVRGGDKLTTTSEHFSPIDATHYRDAVAEAVRRQGRGGGVDVIVVTDDAKYAAPIVALLSQKSSSSSSYRVFVRAIQPSDDRPDFLPALTLARNHNATVRMLADLKTTVLADAFVGTMSSNFGDVACVLRGGRACFDVENGRDAYSWNHEGEKVW